MEKKIKDVKLPLSVLEDSIEENKKIAITGGKSIQANQLLVVKRDGRVVKYDVEKMKRVVLWACNGNEVFAKAILNATEIKLYQKINIADAYDELIKTTANMISRIYPQYESIAGKLLLLKIYRETAGIKKTTDYVSLKTIIDKGLKSQRYNSEVFGSYSSSEIDELNKAINPEYDFLFTYKSLDLFYHRYVLNFDKNQKLELPQHTYMRIAMSLFYQENKKIRLNLVKKFYYYLANQYFTVATPIMLNAGTPRMQLSSCVLSKMGDSAEQIMQAAHDIAIYSKYKGGNAIDITDIRSSGSPIYGNSGYSSGPIPFVKILESTIKAFNQGSQRPGACCVYFPWWHFNFEQLVVLKSNSGTEENRARQLKYSVKINDLLIDRLVKNQDVSLFNPNDVPKLKNKVGKAFNDAYVAYEKDSKIKRRTLSARKVVEMIMKERVETGNVYLFHEENVNYASMLNRYINSSNLCCEICLPSRASNKLSQSLKIDDKTKSGLINYQYQSGEISLCNLASINLTKWDTLNETDQQELVKIVVRALDNTVDIAHYPILEAEYTNKMYRYLGIGVLNYANFLAKHKITIDTQAALEKCHEVFDKLSYQIILASNELAIEKGPFKMFKSTAWSNGDLPIKRANKLALALTQYQPNMHKWNELSKRIVKHGLRNAQLMAIAPTATSGKAINATESIEPIQNFIYKEDGKSNIVTLVPDIAANSLYYKRAIECDQNKLLEAAAIRQMYLDQAQSINIYFKKVSSVVDFTLKHIYGFKLGIKTYYYCKTEKEVAEETCESCT